MENKTHHGQMMIEALFFLLTLTAFTLHLFINQQSYKKLHNGVNSHELKRLDL